MYKCVCIFYLHIVLVSFTTDSTRQLEFETTLITLEVPSVFITLYDQRIRFAFNFLERSYITVYKSVLYYWLVCRKLRAVKLLKLTVISIGHLEVLNPPCSLLHASATAIFNNFPSLFYKNNFNPI